METKILLKRGINSGFSAVTLKAGEPAFITDTGKLYLGDGTKKILINPINKPTSINTTNYYTKMKINDYGQVVEQSNLTSKDIPVIPITQVSGLGSAALINTGSSAGNIPVLDPNARLTESIMPLSVIGYAAMAYYNNVNPAIVASNQYVPFTGLFTNNVIFSMDTNGIISINQPGIYLISYSITSNTLDLYTALGPGPGNTNTWIGSYARSTTTAIIPYTTTSASIYKQVTTVPEKHGVKNIGPSNISIPNGFGNISIFKIG